MPRAPKKRLTRKRKPSVSSAAAVPRGPGKVGAPSVWTPELEQRILERIANGATDTEACDAEGIAYATFWTHRFKSESFAEASARARTIRAHRIAEEILSIADEAPKYGEHGVDSGAETHRRTRIDTRMRLLGKWLPKEFGDKVGVEHSGQVGLSIKIDLA